jgi:hypothetical protein
VDREAIRKRWDADRAHIARVRKPRVPRIKLLQPEVEIRPTSSYEARFEELKSLAFAERKVNVVLRGPSDPATFYTTSLCVLLGRK